MTVYYIVKRAVYDHGCLGIYRTLEEAKARCEQHTSAHAYPVEDGDGYHDFVIYETTLGDAGAGRPIAVWEGAGGRIGVVGTYTWKETAGES